MRKTLIFLLLSLSSLSPAWAEQFTYTENGSASDEVALGYPVPKAEASTQAITGFRDYDSVIARLQALALSDEKLSAKIVGKSHDNRDIWAFQLSDSDDLSADGALIEPSILHSGGIHPREWASVEAVTYIIEEIQNQSRDQGLVNYLVDHLNLVWVPALNPDGVLSTQKHYRHSLRGLDSGPRDGRMRRKNLLNSDDDLGSEDNNLLGVDLNRNIGPNWASGRSNSSTPTSILYRGTSRESEPETQALLAARDWAKGDRLRLYIDTHSYGRILFFNETSNSRLFAISDALANKLGQVPSRPYQGIPAFQGEGIGATDEYFAEIHQVPAYTLEIEPGQQGAVEYGGRGVSHDGFILPAAEVPRMRQEIFELSVLAYYHQAGPPSVQQVQISRADDGSVVFQADWLSQTAQRRSLRIDQIESLQPGESYQLRVQFNKPMRVRDAQNRTDQYPGQSIPLAPDIVLKDQHGGSQRIQTGDWQAAGIRYQNDSWQGSFTLNSQLQGKALRLALSVSDLAGLALDSRPATVAHWQNGSWQAYENSQHQAGDSGGTDQEIEIAYAGQSPASSNGGGSGSLGILLLLIASAGRRRL